MAVNGNSWRDESEEPFCHSSSLSIILNNGIPVQAAVDKILEDFFPKFLPVHNALYFPFFFLFFKQSCNIYYNDLRDSLENLCSCMMWRVEWHFPRHDHPSLIEM